MAPLVFVLNPGLFSGCLGFLVVLESLAFLNTKRLAISGPPAVLVYDRSGKKVKTFTSEDPFTYADVEKLVVPLLKQK